MSDLKPCPFCGGPAKGPRKIGGSDERSGYNYVMCIECATCGVTISRSSLADKKGWCIDKGRAKEFVTETWNRRTPEPKEDV